MASKTIIRIATVKATGERYVVQQIDFRSNKVHCWGELISFSGERGGSAFRKTHAGSKAFLADAVTVTEVEQSEALVKELFAQAKRAQRTGALRAWGR